jgi:hypothetical protein
MILEAGSTTLSPAPPSLDHPRPRDRARLGLPVLAYREACGRLGVCHSYRDGYPAPFTIDFLLTESVDGELHERAKSIKTPKDAVNPEVQQRLRVECSWCRYRAGIPWTVVDTSSFADKTLLTTLEFMACLV